MALPYMNQLPRDFYLKNYPVPVPAPAPPIPPQIVSPPKPPPTPPASQSGGAWYGDLPPVNPQVGWLWVSSVNNGLYIFTTGGLWSQIGTNW